MPSRSLSSKSVVRNAQNDLEEAYKSQQRIPDDVLEVANALEEHHRVRQEEDAAIWRSCGWQPEHDTEQVGNSKEVFSPFDRNPAS